MKIAVAIICFALSAIQKSEAGAPQLPPELKELLDNFHGACMDETGVAQDVVDEVHKGNFQEDPKLKCYFKCMMMQLQVMTSEGSLDMELIEGSIPEELKEHGAMDAIHNCKSISFPDACKTAFEMMDKTGRLDMDYINANMPEGMRKRGALEVVNRCKHLDHEELCEKADILVKCLHRENEAISEMFE